VLAEEGYEYDSSIGPVLRSYASEPWRRFAHLHRHGDRTLWELPISTAEVFGMLIPIAGGNYFRQFPHWMVRKAVDHWTRTYTAPFVMYFHTWELDPDQPKIAAPWVSRVRQYRNLDRMPQYLRYYLGRYRFKSASTVLGLSAAPLRVEPALPRAARSSGAALRLATPESEPGALQAARTPVSVVIPCFNEELILPYLANTLTSVREQFSQYDLTFIFVDDQSTDGTWVALNRIFSDQPGSRLIRHAHNRGVAAGILTGIQNATTDIVCSMDCDCTYDPHELAKMIPMLGDGVDMVTASPYHPEGAVRNVPDWRLALSKTLSRCYRVVLHQRLATYTSCFRVYRRSAMTGLTLRHEGFLGVAEMLGRLDLRGSKIAEYPATLEVRMLGRSKMKILRTIAGHIGLLARFAAMRMRSKA
jgi:hypothetical protein